MNNLFTCSTWQTIETAPKYRPILTNLGLAVFISRGYRGLLVNSGWYLCDSTGYIPHGQGANIAISKLDMPRIWTEFNPPECS
jgi:hypothetical protein